MAIPLLAAGISALPGLFGGISQAFGAKRRRQQEDKAAQGISKLSDLFDSQLRMDYMDTPEAMGAIKEFEDYNDGMVQDAENMANMSGMTDEARLAMRGNAMKNAQGFFSNLARSGNLWRNNVLNQKANTLQSLYSVGQNNRANFNNSLANILNPLSQSISSGFMSGAFDGMMGGNMPKNQANMMTSPSGSLASAASKIYKNA